MKEVEKRAVDIILNESTDFRKICIGIAKNHPTLLVRYHGDTYIDKCKGLFYGGKKIEAIKLWREETKCSLKEAKEAVERL